MVRIFDSGIDVQILLNLKDYLVRYNVFMIFGHGVMVLQTEQDIVEKLTKSRNTHERKILVTTCAL